MKEIKYFPALAVAGEAKIPTARDMLIGTGKTDYTFYLIGSKTFGRFETHANIGYTFVGRPNGMQLDNIIDFAFAGEYHLNNKLDLVAELIGNTSSEPTINGFGGEDVTSPEISGGELVGLFGARYHLTPFIYGALGITYDNNNALMIRSGITFIFNTK